MRTHVDMARILRTILVSSATTAALVGASAWLGTMTTLPEAALIGALLIGSLVSRPRALSWAPVLIALVVISSVGAATLGLSPIVGAASVIGGALVGAEPQARRRGSDVAFGAALAMLGSAGALHLTPDLLVADGVVGWIGLGAAIGGGTALAALVSLLPPERDIPSQTRISWQLPAALRAEPLRASALARSIPAARDADHAAALARESLRLALVRRDTAKASALVGPEAAAELEVAGQEATRAQVEILTALELASADALLDRTLREAHPGAFAAEPLAEVRAGMVERAARRRAWAEVSDRT